MLTPIQPTGPGQPGLFYAFKRIMKNFLKTSCKTIDRTLATGYTFYMTNNANTTATLEYTIRMATGAIVQNAAADAGMTVSEWSTMFDVVVSELVAYGARWTR